MEKSLRIAHMSNVIDNRTNSGTARAAIEIIMKLSEDPSIHQTLIHFEKFDHPIYSLPNTTEIIIPIKPFPIASHTFSFIYFWIKVLMGKRDIKFDAVHWHASRVYPFFFILPASKILITLHDATNRIYKKANTVWTKVFYWNLRIFQNKIDYIIGDSIDACNNLTSIGKFKSDKVKCIYLGSNFDTVKAVRPNNFRVNSFFLCVSRWQPHKNVTTLLLGFNSAYREDASIPNLVLVGKPVNGFDEPAKLISRLQLQHKVLVLKDLSDAELAFLYDHALIHISPSLYEGFGLPVLEGLKRGCPSIDHSGTSTSEVSGIAGMHIDMNNEYEISKALLSLSRNRDFVVQLRESAKSRSNFFTWEKTAANLKKLYFNETA